MRNTTKLTLLLQKYTVSFDMSEDGIFILLLTDKTTNAMHEFEGKTYSLVITKAYSHLLRTLKKPVE